MPHIRRSSSTLLASLFLLTAIASAQPYSCNGTAVPALVRSEGIAEKMGDVVLLCEGSTPPAGIVANIRLRLTANITSDLESTPITEALLVLDEGAGGFRGSGAEAGTQNVYQAVRISDDEIEWQGVVLAAAGTNPFRVLRLTNVRGNVQSRGEFATLYASINVISPTSVPINNNLLVVADSRPGLSFAVTQRTYSGCTVPSGTVDLRFTEGFASSFKPRGTAAADNTTPGGAYLNESGFNPRALAAGALTGTPGQATQGTRLIGRFQGIPAGVTLTVPQTVSTTSGLVATAVTGADSAGAGGALASGPVVVAADGMLVYEVTSMTSQSYSTTEMLSVPVAVSYVIPGPEGSATVRGSFAPASTVYTASATAPEPRFVDSSVATSAFTVQACESSIPRLTELVKALGAPGGPLNAGQINSLVKKLEHVAGKMDRTQAKTACNQLNSFWNEISAFVSGGVLSAAQGDQLISMAEGVGRTVPCNF